VSAKNLKIRFLFYIKKYDNFAEKMVCGFMYKDIKDVFSERKMAIFSSLLIG